jgi:hypothetical protein
VSSSSALTSKLSVDCDQSDHLRAIVASAHFTSPVPLFCQFIFWVNDLRFLKRLTLLFNILELTHLEFLNLSNNAMFSVVSIQSLASVVFLDVSYNPIDDSSFKLSARLQALKVVKAAGTRIAHPSLVARFAPSLEVADFTCARVADIEDAQLQSATTMCTDFSSAFVNFVQRLLSAIVKFASGRSSAHSTIRGPT